MDRARATVVQSAAEVAGALAPHTAELSADIYQLIVGEIPQLRTDSRVLALLEASVAENVATVLHILQHDLDLDRVHAPAAAEQYGRCLAQRGIPLAALLRAYRIGLTRFQHWCLHELAQQTDMSIPDQDGVNSQSSRPERSTESEAPPVHKRCGATQVAPPSSLAALIWSHHNPLGAPPGC